MMSMMNLNIAVFSVMESFSHISMSVVMTVVTVMTVMTVVIAVTMSGIVVDMCFVTNGRDGRNVFTRVNAISRVIRVVLNFDNFLGNSNLFGGWDLNIDVVSLFNSLISGFWHKLGDMRSVGVESMTVMSVVAMVSGIGNFDLVSNWSFPGLNSCDEKGSGEEFHFVFVFYVLSASSAYKALAQIS